MSVSIMSEKCAPYFEADYLISWNVSDSDDPCITVSRLERDGESSRVVCRVLGTFYENTGVVSLQQLLAFSDARALREKEEG